MTSAATSEMNDGYTIIVAQQDDGRFLMVKNAERGWELPGGKFEGKEGPVHCALREFREETGHLLADPRFVMKLQKENGTCFVFKGRLGPKIEERSDPIIEDVEWFRQLPADLAFPDDPYDEMGDALGIHFR